MAEIQGKPTVLKGRITNGAPRGRNKSVIFFKGVVSRRTSKDVVKAKPEVILYSCVEVLGWNPKIEYWAAMDGVQSIWGAMAGVQRGRKPMKKHLFSLYLHYYGFLRRGPGLEPQDGILGSNGWSAKPLGRNGWSAKGKETIEKALVFIVFLLFCTPASRSWVGAPR